LRTQLGQQHLRERSKTSAGQYNINIEGLGAVPIPAVEYKAQAEFVSRSSRVEEQAKIIRSAASAHDELFSSLQSRAFQGDL
jgi:type I restriction enzyme S subunit